MKCKKEIMGLAALMVVLFHFYIPFGTSAFETYIYKSTFIGVDMFFFVSAYSLAGRNKKEEFRFVPFVLNRLGYIYAPFVFLAFVASIYKKWGVVRFLKTISGIEFFERGGGAFLWYFVGIMIIYLLFPVMLMVKRKFKLTGFVVLMASWVALSCVLQFGFNYTKAFILINRLPIFFIGLYYDEFILKNINKLNKLFVYILEAMLFIGGTLLVYKLGTTYRLNKPFADMYYVIAIPLIIATVMIVHTLVTLLEGKYRSILLRFIGEITLELYGLQMVFGYDIEMKLLKVVPVNQLAFAGTVLILIAMAFVMNRIITFIHKTIKRSTPKTLPS